MTTTTLPAQEASVRNGPTLKHEEEHFRIFQPVFAIAISLGYVELFKIGHQSPDLVHIALLLAVAALGFRFLFCVESLSRYVLARRGNSTPIPKWDEWINHEVVFLHYPMMLAHAGLFYALCNALNPLGSQIPFGTKASLDTYCLLAGTLLMANVLWLLFRLGVRSHVGLDISSWRHCEGIWIGNNLVFAVFIFACSQISAENVQAGHVILATLIGVNSLIDLHFTAPEYVPQR